MDRHGRHVAVRPRRLQPGRHPHRRTGRPAQGRQGLGAARLPQPRRHRRARHAQHQDRAAQAAPLCARRRGGPVRHRRYDRLDRAQCGAARPEIPARAAQYAEDPAVPRRRRLDGSARARSARSCSRRRAASSSTSNISTSTTSSTNRSGRTAGAVTASARRCSRSCASTRRLPRDLRRRREHEPVRDHAAGRQHRALERRGRRRVAAAHHAPLPALRVAQSRSRRTAGITCSRSASRGSCWRTACFR